MQKELTQIKLRFKKIHIENLYRCNANDEIKTTHIEEQCKCDANFRQADRDYRVSKLIN